MSLAPEARRAPEADANPGVSVLARRVRTSQGVSSTAPAMSSRASDSSKGAVSAGGKETP